MKEWVASLDQKSPKFIINQQRLDWPQLLVGVEIAAKRWKELGLREGDIVAARGSKRWLIQSWLACLINGLIFCPLPRDWVKPELLEHNPLSLRSGSRQLLWYSEGEPCQLTEELVPQWSFLDGLKEISLLLRTSGTSERRSAEVSGSINNQGSGYGRWVAYEGASIRRQILSHSERMRPHSSSERLQLLPLYHTFGLILDLSIGLELAQTITLIESDQLLTSAWLKLLEAKDCALTPRLAHLVCQYHATKSQSYASLLHIGGARVSDKLSQQCSKAFEHVIEGYGLTECGPGVLLDHMPIDCEVALELIDETTLNQETIGYGCNGSLGLLKVKSTTLGHWENRQLQEGWYSTQDLVFVDQSLLAKPKWHVMGRFDRSHKQRDGRWIWLDALEGQWERSLGLGALRLQITSQGKLLIALLEEESFHAPIIERWAKRLFDLPLVVTLQPTLTQATLMQGGKLGSGKGILG